MAIRINRSLSVHQEYGENNNAQPGLSLQKGYDTF